jgi:hypothetical protein
LAQEDEPRPKWSPNDWNNHGPIRPWRVCPYITSRPITLGLAKALLLVLAQLPLMFAAPIHFPSLIAKLGDGTHEDSDNPSLWLYLGVATTLVLTGGVFAGLTIALMGQVGETVLSSCVPTMAPDPSDPSNLG